NVSRPEQRLPLPSGDPFPKAREVVRGERRVGGEKVARGAASALEDREVAREPHRAKRGRAVLAGAEQVAGAAEAEVFFGDAEAVLGRLEDATSLGRARLGAVHQDAEAARGAAGE